jgi:hypothetical protein
MKTDITLTYNGRKVRVDFSALRKPKIPTITYTHYLVAGDNYWAITKQMWTALATCVLGNGADFLSVYACVAGTEYSPEGVLVSPKGTADPTFLGQIEASPELADEIKDLYTKITELKLYHPLQMPVPNHRVKTGITEMMKKLDGEKGN